MPRDANGNYTLPAGNPVITGTPITTSWANPTMQDIGNELTNSLSRTGEGGMLVPFQFVDGARATPGITWTNETTTGFYREGAGDMRVSVGATVQFRWTATGADVWTGADWLSATTTVINADAGFIGQNQSKIITDYAINGINGFVSSFDALNQPEAGNFVGTALALDATNTYYIVRGTSTDKIFHGRATAGSVTWSEIFSSENRSSAEANTILDNASAGQIGQIGVNQTINVDTIAINGFTGIGVGTNTPNNSGALITYSRLADRTSQIYQSNSGASATEAIYHRNVKDGVGLPWKEIFSSDTRTSAEANALLTDYDGNLMPTEQVSLAGLDTGLPPSERYLKFLNTPLNETPNTNRASYISWEPIDGYGGQLQFTQGGGIYTRDLNNGSWGAWEKISTSANGGVGEISTSTGGAATTWVIPCIPFKPIYIMADYVVGDSWKSIRCSAGGITQLQFSRLGGGSAEQDNMPSHTYMPTTTSMTIAINTVSGSLTMRAYQ